MQRPKWLAKRTLLQVLTATVIVAGAAVLLELWFAAFSEWFLSRLLVTCAVVVVVAGVLLAIAGDMEEDEANKKDRYLN